MQSTYLIAVLIAITLPACKGPGISESKTAPTTTAAIPKVKPVLSEKIWSIYQDTKGNYWFGSNDKGLYRYAGDSLQLFTEADGLVDNQIRGVQEDRLGNIYVETPKGVSLYDGQTFRTLAPVVSQDNVWKLAPTDLWFNCNGNADHVYRYDGEALYALKLPRQDLSGVLGIYEDNLSYSPYTVFGIEKDQQGNIWFGTVIAGAFRYDGESFLWVGEKELSRLPDGREPGVRSILEDKDGNIWLSNFISKYRINSDVPTQYEKLPAIEGVVAYFNAGVADNNGDLWMTTYSDGLWKYDGAALLHYPIANGDIDVLLISIYKDQEGVLWLGTDNDGVYKYNGETFEKFRPKR